MYVGTPVEQAAEVRVLNTQIGLYRWSIMNAFTTHRQERKKMADKIYAVLNRRQDIPFRQRLNYTLMHHMPILYKLTYSLYDRIRVPNWDVKV